jgi:hypothetical protein
MIHLLFGRHRKILLAELNSDWEADYINKSESLFNRLKSFASFSKNN